MADHRHKRDTDARSLTRDLPTAKKISAGLAVLATGSVVAFGVLGADPGHPASSPPTSAARSAASAPTRRPTSPTASCVSRSASRKRRRRTRRPPSRRPAPTARWPPPPPPSARPQQDTKLWTTAPLNLWTESGQTPRRSARSPPRAGARHRPPGRRARRDRRRGQEPLGHRRLPQRGQARGSAPAPASRWRPCPDPGVESGLTSGAVYVYRSVCHAFPQITTYGGWDNHGEHASGRALDIMTSDVALGTAIAEFLQAHASELHLYDILWRQHIWTPVRASEGWRSIAEPRLGDRQPLRPRARQSSTDASPQASATRVAHDGRPRPVRRRGP